MGRDGDLQNDSWCRINPVIIPARYLNIFNILFFPAHEITVKIPA